MTTILSEAVLRQHAEEVQKALDTVDGLRRDLAIAQGENSELKAACSRLEKRNQGLESMAEYTAKRVVELETRIRSLHEQAGAALDNTKAHHDQNIETLITEWASSVKKDDNSPQTTESDA